MRQQVRILPAASPTIASERRIDCVFTVEPSHALPVIDTRKTIKSMLLSATALRRCNAFLHRFGRVLTATTGTLVLIVNGVMFMPAGVGRVVALLATPLMQPAMAATILGMRYEMVLLLLRTYEFWHRCLISVTCPILFAACTQDARVLVAVGLTPNLLAILLADANCRAMKNFVALSVGAALINLSDGLFLVFGRLDDAHRLVVFSVYGRAVTAESVMANGFFMITVTSLHNAYVRRGFASRKRTATGDPSTTVHCILYRCRLRWVPHTEASPAPHQPSPPSTGANVLQLRCRGFQQTFDARKTLLPWFPDPGIADRSRWVRVLRCACLVCGVAGFFGVHATFLAKVFVADGDSLVLALGTASFTLTVSVVAFFVCFVYQLDILYRLHSNFDFVVISTQLLLAHVCLCDLCGWDGRAIASASSLLWIYWALLADAVPPATCQRLGLRVKRLAVFVEMNLVVGMVVIAFDLTSWRLQAFVDHEFLHGLANYRRDSTLANWSVGSILLNRVVTLVPWLCRSLWRLATFDDDELTVLRGVVEYDDFEMHRRKKRAPEATTAPLELIQRE